MSDAMRMILCLWNEKNLRSACLGNVGIASVGHAFFFCFAGSGSRSINQCDLQISEREFGVVE